MLELRLLGPGRLTLDGRVVRLHSAKSLALLAFLALEADRPHARARLASLLWGDRPEAAARQSLRQALYSLGRCAEGRLRGYLDVGQDFVGFVRGDGLEVDALRFSALVQSSQPGDWDAAAAYPGPLLEGLALEGCTDFDAWLGASRDRLHALAMQNLERLVVDRATRSDWDGALRHALALRSLDPLSELASRSLLRIHAARDDARAIDAEWLRLRSALARELGVEPSPASLELYASLRRDRRRTAGARSVVRPAEGPPAVPPDRNGGAADAFFRAARAAERVYAFANALELHERALGLLRQADPPVPARICEVLLSKEAMLARLGRRAEQSATIEEAAAIAGALDDPATMAIVQLRKAGAGAYLDGDAGAHGMAWQKARQAAHRALEVFRDTGDRPGEAEALRELGFIAWRAGDHATALRHSRQALELHRQLGDVAGEASALHNLGEIHRGLGSPRQALELYARALPLHWAARNREGEILTVFAEATAHRQLGDLAQAGERYAAALSLSERHGERTMQSRALHALAVHARAQGRLDDAMRFMQQAVDVDRAINYAHALRHDLVELAAIHMMRAERAQALAALHEAIAWCGFTGDDAAMESVRAWLDAAEAGLPPPMPAHPVHGVRSHVPLPEGKVYCEFESPLAAGRVP